MFTLETRPSELCDEGYECAISNIDGSYIGMPDFAQQLQDMGIAAEARPGHTVASIGYNAVENKWYGWSHRAIFGFGIGSKVSKGDCGYVPTDWDDLIEDAIRFWDDEGHIETTAHKTTDDKGQACVKVQWIYSSDAKIIPNTSIHGTTGSTIMYPPDKWGRGEWTAKTIEDAKQMAADFAEGVS